MPLINKMHEIHMEDFDLNLLAVLDALLREGSVTLAAKSLGMTQSATSHALNRLRAFFDDPLFVKSSAGMVPTLKAQSLGPHVFQVMADVRQRILPSARFEPRTANRTFTLCMTDMGELVFLPKLIGHLRQEAPLCAVRTVQVPIDQIEGLLGSGDADLAVGSLRSAPEGLFQQRLFNHSFVTIVSRNNTEIGEQLTLQQFEQMPHIVVSLTGRASTAYDAALEDQGIKRWIFLTTPHFLIVPLLMEKNPEFIATVPLELAHTFERYGMVRVMDPPVALPGFSLNQHWHPRFHHDPAVIWLRQLMKRAFEPHPSIQG